MAVDFDVEMSKFPDNVDEATTAAAIETWLDNLSITTVHSLTVAHHQGFWKIIAIYV